MNAQVTRKIRIGVIGLGQWGPNQVRAFVFNPNCQVVRVCDKDESRLKFIGATYPAIEVASKASDITKASDIDAVVITTPVCTHFELAKEALLNGKDVLCEKPMTADSKSARFLVNLAKRKKRILMIGHVFLFNPGILKMKELMKEKVIGKTYYLHAKRTNLGPVRNDVNAVYDLASHDISIFNFLLESSPKVVSAVGNSYLQKGVEDVAFVSLRYPNNVLAHIHVSWLDPKKIRQLTVVGDQKMLTWDDMASQGPVEIYSKTVEKNYHHYKDFGEFHLLVKEGEVVIPFVKGNEPLRLQADHFAQSVLQRKKPLTDGDFGLRVVLTLETIEKLLKKSR